MPGASLGLLNAFSLHCDGEHVPLPATAQRLLAFLALQPRLQPQPRAHVADALWTDSTTDRASGSLRSVLWRLGRLQPGLVIAAGDDLSLAGHVEVDVHRVWALAVGVIDGGEPPADAGVLAHDILPDWDDEWLRVVRDRFRQVRLHALEILSTRLAGERRYGEAVGAAMVAVAADPLRETAHRALIGAYLAEGNRGDALHQYRTCHRIFRDGLGMPPSSALDDLIGQALARE